MVMLIGGVPFDRASGIDLTRDQDGQPVLVTPHLDHPNPRRRKLHGYGSGPFSDLVLSKLPRQLGVYAVVDGVGLVRYVGKAEGSVAERGGLGRPYRAGHYDRGQPVPVYTPDR